MRGEGERGVLLKLIGIRNLRNLWSSWLYERRKETLELFPPDRQPFPLDERTFFLLSLSLSLSLSFLGNRVPECKFSIISHPFLFLVRLSNFFICHYVTGCFIFKGKHFRAGITVLMTAYNILIDFATFFRHSSVQRQNKNQFENQEIKRMQIRVSW